MTSCGPHQPKMSSRAMGKSPGWTAFHHKQLQGHDVETKSEVELYPPLLCSSSSIPPSQSGTLPLNSSQNQKSDKNGLFSYKLNNDLATSSFSSIVKSSLHAMPLVKCCNCEAMDLSSNPLPKNKHICNGMIRSMTAEEKKRMENIEKLKQDHSWADDTLIEDILAAIDNNEDQAGLLLRSMDLSSNSSSKDKDISNNKMKITNPKEKSRFENIQKLKKRHCWADNILIEDILAAVENNEEQASLLFISMCPTGYEAEGITKQNDDDIDSSDKKLTEVNQLSDGQYRKLTAPVEPEWEEDDMYLSHRKDAIKMMRLASRHSQGANGAFSRGDHFNARQLSQRAREEWLAAQKLNLKAAEEILHIRNKGNDMWKLDLHGLHASEAVQALQVHLKSIESLLMMNDLASSAKISNREGGLSAECTNSLDREENREKASLQVCSSRPQRQTTLAVITGTGKHSRGDASLPAAVRSFLLISGYHFHDARPGVISVRPKFRHCEVVHGESG